MGGCGCGCSCCCCSLQNARHTTQEEYENDVNLEPTERVEADDDFGMEVGDDVEDVSQLEIVSWRNAPGDSVGRLTPFFNLTWKWKIDEN